MIRLPFWCPFLRPIFLGANNLLSPFGGGPIELFTKLVGPGRISGNRYYGISLPISLTFSHLKIGVPKRKVAFQPPIFRCYISFREGYCGRVIVGVGGCGYDWLLIVNSDLFLGQTCWGLFSEHVLLKRQQCKDVAKVLFLHVFVEDELENILNIPSNLCWTCI